MKKQAILGKADLTIVVDNASPVAIYDKDGNKLSFQYFDHSKIKAIGDSDVVVNGEKRFGSLSEAFTSIDVEFELVEQE